MDPKLKRFVLGLLRDHQTMNLATVRPDGFPQVTTVTYANDGLDLYFVCGRESQKVANLKKNKKVSLTIDRDCDDWNRIKGLSMGGVAAVLTKREEIAKARRLLVRKFPEMGQVSAEDAAQMAVVKVTPKVISVLNYALGFGHTDLVAP